MEEKQDNITPADNTPQNTEPAGNDPSAGNTEPTPPPQTTSAAPPPTETNGTAEAAASTPAASDESMSDRLERLGGEPAPVITPEEFARLQQAGQVHIDSRGRVRTARRSDAEAGVSLRKRRAWYDR